MRRHPSTPGPPTGTHQTPDGAASPHSLDAAAARRRVLRRRERQGREHRPRPISRAAGCMGGGSALLLAPNHGFTAASVNYGTASKDVYTDQFLTGACPIVGSYGKKDRVNRGTAVRLERILTAVGGTTTSRNTPTPDTCSSTTTPPPTSPRCWPSGQDDRGELPRAVRLRRPRTDHRFLRPAPQRLNPPGSASSEILDEPGRRRCGCRGRRRGAGRWSQRPRPVNPPGRSMCWPADRAFSGRMASRSTRWRTVGLNCGTTSRA